MFLYTFGRRTYCVDLTPFRDGRAFCIRDNDQIRIHESLLALEDLEVGDVAGVVEVFVSAVGAPECLRLAASHAQAVLEPLKDRARGKKRRKTPANGSESADESSDSADARQEKFRDDVQGSSSGSSLPSADTDADSALDDDLDDIPKANNIDLILSRHLPDKVVAAPAAVEVAVPGVDMENEGLGVSSNEVERLPRHAPGTWKVWESAWFYITKTPGWTDVKIWVKHAFRGVTNGMGREFFSKTLTPYHYNDEMDDPWRTFLLLRAWSIWRARLGGWAKQREGRLRELERQVSRFEIDLRAGQAKVPGDLLLGSVQSQTLLEKWVPDVVAKVCG